MKMQKQLILPEPLLRELAASYGTPLYVYSSALMRERARELSSIAHVRYAMKANANLLVLRCLRAEGVSVEAVSAGEILRALAAGFRPAEILYSADLFEPGALELVRSHALTVNAGSIGMLAQLAQALPGAQVRLRINPGFGSGYGPRVVAGGSGSKHGIWHTEIPAALASASALGLNVQGLHLHIGSGIELELAQRAAEALITAVRWAGKTVRVISAGGGLSIPYRAGEKRQNLSHYRQTWQDTRSLLERELGHPLQLEIEPGRYLVAEAGLLLTSVRCIKRVEQCEVVLVDAGFHTLLRPALYGAWHELRALVSERGDFAQRVVAGPLCEPGDVFTHENGAFAPRLLPRLEVGDVVAVLDTGAYGASMASNYNSHPLPAEVLVTGSRACLARPRQRLEDLFGGELNCLGSHELTEQQGSGACA